METLNDTSYINHQSVPQKHAPQMQIVINEQPPLVITGLFAFNYSTFLLLTAGHLSHCVRLRKYNSHEKCMQTSKILHFLIEECELF